MDPRLKAILQKAKAIDERAKKYDNVDTAVLESKVSTRQVMPSVYEQVEPVQKTVQKVEVSSEMYKQRVKESKLPPEIQRAMLENPIPQPDAPGMFSLDEEDIKEINPSYGNQQTDYYSEDDEIDFLEKRVTPKRNIVEQKTTVSSSVSEGQIRKMIAEEIAKALPTIVEKYFDKKMIQENVKILKTLNSKVKRVQ
jgi:hypothetical protein